MYFILNFAIFIALLSPWITHLIWRNKWTESRLSRGYIRKNIWGLRYFLFPALCVYVLLQIDFKTFCAALFGLWLSNILLRLVFGSDKAQAKWQLMHYFWLIPLALSWSQNEPFWIQIWPTFFFGVTAVFVLLARKLKKPHWLKANFMPMKNDNEGLSEKMLYGIFFISFLVLTILNELFRQKTSLETWAVFNAFNQVFVVAVLCAGAVFIIPAFYDRKEKQENVS